MRLSIRFKITILASLSLALIAAFMLINASGNWDYVLPKRGIKIGAIVLAGAAIAFSTQIFQTITNNRILTPSIIGLDSLYMFIQTFVIFVYGSMSTAAASKHFNFVLSVGIMILFVGLLYKLMFKREGRNLYFLLLIGIIFGTFFNSLSTFMQVLIDPKEFQIVQDRMFASFNNVNKDLLLISTVIFALVGLYTSRYMKYLDALSLGQDQAVNLGVPYHKVVKRLLIVVAILISVSTALVGPITFLGLIVANLSHQFMKTYRHKYLIVGSILISIVALVGGQLLIERVFEFSTTISVIINFIGGAYFLYLLLRENKS